MDRGTSTVALPRGSKTDADVRAAQRFINGPGTLVVTPVRGDVLMTAGLDHSVGSVLAFRHLSFARAVCDRSRRFVRGEGTS